MPSNLRAAGEVSDKTASFLPLTTVVFEILLALADGERHGYAILKEVAERTHHQVRLRPGSLYRAISRLLDGGFVAESEERPAHGQDDERRRYYRLTDLGRAVATAEARRLEISVDAARAKQLLGGRESF